MNGGHRDIWEVGGGCGRDWVEVVELIEHDDISI